MKIMGLAIAISVAPYPSKAQVQQMAQALSPVQVNLRARQITVRIDGSGIGSGVIIEQMDDTYTVLTNWHVVQNEGQYTVQTIDGRQHSVKNEDIQRILNLDLALVKFTTNQNYQTADLGNSAQLIEGQNIYFSGYPGELRQEDNRYYRFFTANLVGILPQYTESGYSLVYNGDAFPGMSGGPVFDDNALLIGIYGEANIHALTGAISNYAIPIDIYRQAIAANNDSSGNVSEQSSPENSNVSDETEVNPPEVTVETNNPNNTVLSSTETETNSENQGANSQTNQNPEASTEATEINNSEPEIVAATNTEEEPTATNSENSSENSQTERHSEASTEATETNNSEPETVVATNAEAEATETNSENSSENSQTERHSEASTEATETNNSEPETVAIVESEEKEEEIINTPLISAKTGIDYSSLRSLLSEQQWKEANIQTNDLLDEIIEVARKINPQTFMELRPLTKFACNDMEQIDRLWQEYSDGSFGFSPQQEIWTYVNEQKEFSTKAWRNFATIVGWKEGDIEDSGGYLLYEQLVFNSQKAPIGHLPWWFSANQEQQDMIKQAFNHCNFKAIEKDVEEDAEQVVEEEE
ncbi:MAG: GUN4 domain-containing protein [Xenococcaceae cyanobacterium]